MTTKELLLAALCLAFLSSSAALAQQTTEQYVPIGASPGISGKYSTIGRIRAIDRDERKITVEHDGGRRTFTVTDATLIWLDRNRWKRTNLEGSYRDCKVGRHIEVMYSHDDESLAAWIKVEARERR